MFSYETLYRVVLQPLIDNEGWDTAAEYGEPGYGSLSNPERLVVLGDYWCRCKNHPHAGGRSRYDGRIIEPTELHGYDLHHPRAWQALEEAGVQFEWNDEWAVDYHHDKAYRTRCDSYSWQPSAIIDDNGELLTPDDDIEEWISYVENDPSRCLLSRVHGPADIEAIGFQQWRGPDGTDGDPYESGWHPGQTDDPKKVYDEIVEHFDPDDVEVVFCIVQNSQFYSTWAAFYRPTAEEEKPDEST